MDRAGPSAARLCAGAARSVAVLGGPRETGFPQRALHVDPDDAGFFAGADGPADGAGDDRGGGRGDAARGGAGGGRGAAASAVLAEVSGTGLPAADRDWAAAWRRGARAFRCAWRR